MPSNSDVAPISPVATVSIPFAFIIIRIAPPTIIHVDILYIVSTGSRGDAPSEVEVVFI